MTVAELPPGPASPAIVQRLQYLHDPLAYLERCHAAFGDIFTLKLAKRGMVLLANPKDVRELFVEQREAFAAGAAKAMLFGPVVGSSSLLLDGEAHANRRRMLLPHFRNDSGWGKVEHLRSLCEQAIAAWLRRGQVCLHTELRALVRSVISHAIFGSVDPEVERATEAFVDHAVGSKLLMVPALQRDLGPWSPWGRVRRIIARADEAVYREIKRRRAAPAQADLLGSLLAASGDGGALTDEEIRDEVLTLFVAGHEITSAVLSWMFYAIIARADVEARVVREVLDTRAGRPIDRAMLDELAYLDAVMRESMRFYSTIPNGSVRIAQAPVRLRGYAIGPGTLVSVAMHLLHRHPGSFREPGRFLPERFLDAKFSPYDYAPFGGGDRRCLGMFLAMHQMKMIIATVLPRLRLASTNPSVRAERRGAFLAPAAGLPVRVAAR